jgi:hypothetical protein
MRAAREWRRALHGSLWQRTAVILGLLTPPVFIWIATRLYLRLAYVLHGRTLQSATSSQAALEMAFLISGAMIAALTGIEFLREAWFADDQEMFGLAPVAPGRHLAYRSVIAVARAGLWSCALLAFPACLAYFLPGLRVPPLLMSILLIAYWATAVAAGLSGASLLLWLVRKAALDPRDVFVVLYILNLLLCLKAFSLVLDPDSFARTADQFVHHRTLTDALPQQEIANLAANYHRLTVVQTTVGVILTVVSPTLAVMTYCCLGRKLWEGWRPTYREASLGATRRYHLTGRRFSSNPSWAILQKDIKDLTRNPAYRNATAGVIVLLAIALWIQSRSAKDSQLLMLVLNLVYFVPLIWSPRAIGQDARFMDIYALSLSDGSRLLSFRLNAHSLVNVVVTFVSAVPFFLFLKPGFQPHTMAYFAIAATIFVPPLTALALALGVLSPASQAVPVPLGINLKGMLCYFLLAIPLYSLLLNRIVVGVAIHALCLTAVALCLCRAAQNHLRSKGE